MTAFIGTKTISPQLISDEFALTIALVVFVMLTAILLTLLIALAASKSFRRVFFHDKPKKTDKKSRTDRNAETAANEQNASADNAPEYFGGVMTVPIGAPMDKRGNKKQQSNNKEPDIYDKIATVAIPEPDKHTSSVYTVRTTSNVRPKTAANTAAAKRTTSTVAAKGAASTKATTSVKDKKPTSSNVAKKR